MKTLAVTAALTAPFLLSTVRAEGEPLSLTATGTSVAGYIAGAAGAGVAILAGLYGIRVIISAFKKVK